MIAPRKKIEHLATICGRLASDFENERAVAASLASAMLEGIGLNWPTLITRAFAEPAPIYAPPPAPMQTRDPHFYDPLGGMEVTIDLFEELLSAVQSLNDWERRFLSKLIAQENTDLSPKQRTSLSWILKKRDQAAAKAERAAKAAREECHHAA